VGGATSAAIALSGVHGSRSAARTRSTGCVSRTESNSRRGNAKCANGPLIHRDESAVGSASNFVERLKRVPRDQGELLGRLPTDPHDEGIVHGSGDESVARPRSGSWCQLAIAPLRRRRPHVG